MTQYRLYFGRAINYPAFDSHGGLCKQVKIGSRSCCPYHYARTRVISALEFNQFLADSVTTRFDAYTVIEASGHWKGQAEPSTIVEVIANEFQYNDPAKAVKAIAREYCARFNQESVLVTSVELGTFELVSLEVKAA